MSWETRSQAGQDQRNRDRYNSARAPSADGHFVSKFTKDLHNQKEVSSVIAGIPQAELIKQFFYWLVGAKSVLPSTCSAVELNRLQNKGLKTISDDSADIV